MKVSVVGLGIMGSAVVRKLLAAEQSVVITSRTKRKAEALINLGAKWAESPGEAARDADIVITMVTDPQAVQDVTLGEQGVLASIGDQSVHAEMSTVSPRSADDIAAHYRNEGKRFVQAPVLGSRKQIEDSTLLIMAGGKEADIETCQQVWQKFSKKTWHIESAAQAAAMKLSCNMLIAQMILGLGQSLVFARDHGVEQSMFLEVLEQSALNAPMYKSKGQAFISGNFQPNFTVSNMLKDIILAQEAAAEINIQLASNSLAQELFNRATQNGLSDEDYSAVIKVIAEGSGVA
jgi:3-hydroxyisobutyrate dehydrogenase-like beta-hydroxyacid dehydrogenase